MNVVAPCQTTQTTLDDLKQSARAASTGDLKADLSRLLGLTAENLLRLAVIVAELESRGEDLAGLKMGLLPVLRMIASGKLLPELAVLYAAQIRTLTRLAAMTIAQQQGIISSGGLPLPKPTHCGPLRTVRRPHEPKGVDRATLRDKITKPNVAQIAEQDPRDVADMITDIIAKSPRPDRVLLETLKRLARHHPSVQGKQAAAAALVVLEQRR